MRLAVGLFPCLLCVQVIDTVLYFPREPMDLFHVPIGNKLYVAARESLEQHWHLYILDCSTYAARNVIPIGRGGERRGVLDWKDGKVYYATGAGLAVLDNRTDSMVKLLDVPCASPPAYNSLREKVYVASGEVLVVDCRTDSVIKRIPNCGSQFALWDSISDKLYVGAGLSARVAVIDCARDSLVAEINPHLLGPDKAVLNVWQRKLYVGSIFGGGAVIDCVADTLITTLPVDPDGGMVPLVWSYIEDKIYWPGSFYPDGDSISVVDCRVDSVLYRLPLPGELPLLYDCKYLPWSNRLYCTGMCGDSTGGYSFLAVVDCNTDSVIAGVPFGHLPVEIECNPLESLVYISDWPDSCVYVVRDEIVGGVEEHRGPEPEPCFRLPSVTVVRGVLVLGAVDSRQNTAYKAELLDISGRKVMELQPGENDVSHLAPGVYLVREHSVFGSQHSAASGVGRDASSTRKVIVQH